MKQILYLLAIVLSFSAAAQNSIKGKVVIEGTGTALQGTSVFLNNTSIGAISGPDGSFQLINIPDGKYDLIISNVGYETISYSFTTNRMPLNLKVEMKSKIVVLDNVTVGGYITETWEKWGQVFLNEFLGTTDNAKRCKIVNHKVIHFSFYKKQNKLEAIADEPLIIQNKALGYNIQYQLLDFHIEFKDHASYFAGYVLFKERNKSMRNAIIKKRNQVYYGSMLHFMRSVYNNTISNEGFVVRRMQRVPNAEKERVRQVYRNSIVVTDTLKNIRELKISNKDSAAYYNTVLRQKDYEYVYSNYTLTADSIIIDRDNQFKLLFWKDYLAVTYMTGTEERAYLEYMRETRKPIPPFSLLTLKFDQKLIINANGDWFPPQNVVSMVYWGWSEKISNMLPIDYEPKK